MIPELGSDGCSSLLPLQKMLMKQQDRLEEREQDIEEQLYKLESDKRLVEVMGPAPSPAPRGTGVGSRVGMGKDPGVLHCQRFGAAKGLTLLPSPRRR